MCTQFSIIFYPELGLTAVSVGRAVSVDYPLNIFLSVGVNIYTFSGTIKVKTLGQLYYKRTRKKLILLKQK